MGIMGSISSMIYVGVCGLSLVWLLFLAPSSSLLISSSALSKEQKRSGSRRRVIYTGGYRYGK